MQGGMIMKHYENLLEVGCFTRKQAVEVAGSVAAANMLIYDYQKRGLIEKVKRDLYVTISLETKQPVVSRYRIGSFMFDDSCISHHSAFEVYGYANQVFYDCYVSTKKRFTDFEYDGVMYHRVEPKVENDIVEYNGIHVTSIEQTVVDSIRDYEKIVGLEEVLRCLILIPGLSEEKILNILKLNANGFLYQKCGYIFEELKSEFNFSEKFFDECEKYSSNAKRYLVKGSKNHVINERWKLYVPRSLKALIDKGVSDYDAI